MSWPLLANPRLRRPAIGLAAVVLGLLTLWPQPYLARAQLLPNPANGIISSIIGAGGANAGAGILSSLLGGLQSPDVDLDLARSQQVFEEVAAQLHAKGRLKLTGRRALEKVRRAADIEVIRGGILQISVRNHDQRFARDTVQAYVDSVQRRSAAMSEEQTRGRKAAGGRLLNEATARLQEAQAAMDRFRMQNHLPLPPVALGGAVARLSGLQASLAAEQASLNQILRFATPQSFEVQSAQARIAALEKEIAEQQTQPETQLSGPNLAGLTPQISTYENLYRNSMFAQTQYVIYQRYMEALASDEASAQLGLSVVQPTYISSIRQYNIRFFALLVIVLMLGVGAEFYVARPPPGEPR
jgi:hypothetical protein